VTALIIGLILLAAFGPVLWILPSRTDRRLSAMRSRARSHGLQVEVTQLPDLDPRPEARVTAGARRLDPVLQCCVYRLGLAPDVRAAPQWMIRRDAESRAPLPGWRFVSPASADDDYWRQVTEVVATLPPDALGCEALASEVACWWKERSTPQDAAAAVDALHASLAKLGAIQRAANERAMASLDVESPDDEGSTNA
jgi:hypothetical protein